MGQQQPPDTRAAWGDFPDTVLHFASATTFSVDLRRDIDGATSAYLSCLGFERSFGVVSAQDPMGVTPTATANADLAARLQTEVAAMRAAYACLDACNPDRSHCEKSIAIALDLQSSIALAYRYNQLAIFWFDGESFWIVPVYSDNAVLRLPAPT
ncbi:MAG TPA: DUF3293 domain-containing protein [Gemmatimonadaceae bacterium]